MFRLLKSLTALILLGTGTCQVITKSGLMDISSCPITFYGQRYERLLVNTTHDAFTVCFTGHVKPGTTGDCIVVPRVTGDSFQSDIRTDFFRLGSPLHQQVPTVKTEGTCFIDVAMGSTSETEIFLTLFNFGTQAVMWLMKTIDHPNGVLLVDLLVNGETIQQLNISNNHTKSGSFYDISGCRYSGGVLRPNTLLSLERCSRVNCDETAVLRRIRLCDPTGHCHGNGCLLETMCTVIGPTVIDIQGQVTSVQDCCAYELLSPSSQGAFQVVANFHNHHREDATAVGGVILQLDEPHVHIYLEQGGTVWVDNHMVVLNSKPQQLHGVDLSKDHSGVTATVSFTNHTISVFFNGYMVQIHVRGIGAASVQGLCSDSRSPWNLWRHSKYSDFSCKKPYQVTPNRTITCIISTERCNLLKGAPFTSCDIDPWPYVTACTSTLCKSPAVGGLSHCHFLEAYARDCEHCSNNILAGWKSKVNCTP